MKFPFTHVQSGHSINTKVVSLWVLLTLVYILSFVFVFNYYFESKLSFVDCFIAFLIFSVHGVISFGFGMFFTIYFSPASKRQGSNALS